MRLKVQLAFGPPAGTPDKFWWAPEPGTRTVADLLQQLGAHLGLDAPQRRRLAASMGGYALLAGSAASLLRDADELVLGLGHKRGAAEAGADGGAAEQPAAKRPAPAASSSSSDEDSSSSEESSSEEDSSSSEESSSEEESSGSEGEGQRLEDFQTPGAATPAPADQATTGKRPSRSARRKAAKRRLRRMGALPQGGAAAAAAVAQAAAPAPPPAVAHPPARGKQPAGGKASEQPAAAKAAREPAQPAAPGGKQAAQQHQQTVGPPEVTVAPEWRGANGAAVGDRQKQQRPRQGWQAQQQPEQPEQGLQPAMSDAAFVALPPLEGAPRVGDVLAYRLLEIGAELQPAVSEVRCGRVMEATAAGVTLQPHPDPGVHPLAYQRALRRVQRLAALAAAGVGEEEEEEEEEEGPASQYDEAGMLAADLASFVELRVVRPAAGRGAQRPAAPAAAGGRAPAAAVPAAVPATTDAGGDGQAAAADGELGLSSYSQLGPPRPAAGNVIAAEGGWASLYEQLRQRRSQLAQAGAAQGTPPATAGKAAVPAAKSAPPAAGGGSSSAPRGSAGLTPGATRPRAGVRRSALGPMLRILRDNQEL